MKDVVPFSYSSVSTEIAGAARRLADRIRAYEKATVTEMISIGRDLIAIKERLGHGRFGDWLQSEFPTGARTARRYMNAATTFGANFDSVSHLPVTSVYALAAPEAPAEARDALIARIEAGERVEPREISSRLATARNDEKIRKREEAKSQARRNRERRTREQREREAQENRARWAADEKRQADAIAAAACLLVEDLDPARLDELLALLGTASIRSGSLKQAINDCRVAEPVKIGAAL